MFHNGITEMVYGLYSCCLILDSGAALVLLLETEKLKTWSYNCYLLHCSSSMVGVCLIQMKKNHGKKHNLSFGCILQRSFSSGKGVALGGTQLWIFNQPELCDQLDFLQHFLRLFCVLACDRGKKNLLCLPTVHRMYNLVSEIPQLICISTLLVHQGFKFRMHNCRNPASSLQPEVWSQICRGSHGLNYDFILRVCTFDVWWRY